MTIEILGLLGTGFLLGVQHSFDADHLAAVSTLVPNARNIGKSMLIGALWGVGHTMTIILVGIMILFLRISIPSAWSRVFEFLVGVMLLYLGASLLKRIFVDKIHIHRHAHGDHEHIHVHSHKVDASHAHIHRPLIIGMVHGLAGSATITLLVLATISSKMQGLMFIALFGIGSILGMMLSSAIIALPLRLTANHQRLGKIFMMGVSMISILIGAKVLTNNWIF